MVREVEKREGSLGEKVGEADRGKEETFKAGWQAGVWIFKKTSEANC